MYITQYYLQGLISNNTLVILSALSKDLSLADRPCIRVTEIVVRAAVKSVANNPHIQLKA